MNYSEYVPIFKAVSDEKRLKIIDMLSCGSLCACRILEHFNFSQPALSQHMKVLVDCGLVSGLRVGNWMHYSLNKEKYKQVSQYIFFISSEKKDNGCVKESGKCSNL